jgi:hypothetical protein
VYALRRRIATAVREKHQQGHAASAGAQWWELDPAPFVDASRVLIDEIRNRGGQGALAMAAISLQRDAVELTLKALFRAACDVLHRLGEAPQPPAHSNRDRLDYWLNQTSTVIDEVGLAVPSSLNLMVAALKDLNQLDGVTWRYRVEKERYSGEPIFPEERMTLVSQLQDQLEEAIRQVYGWGDGEGLLWDLVTITNNMGRQPRD